MRILLFSLKKSAEKVRLQIAKTKFRKEIEGAISGREELVMVWVEADAGAKLDWEQQSGHAG